MKDKKKITLLVNLGSPEELTVSAIKKFLSVFLSDKRVVGLPKFLWYPILFGIILPFRSKKLLTLYANIWHASNKSPITYYTEEQAKALDNITTDDTIVRHAFSYSEPTIESVLQELHDMYEVIDLKVIPLYPQFSSTTTSSVFDKVSAFYKNKYYLPNINFVRDFHKKSDYIDLITEKIRQSWEINGKSDKLVISYHSLPVNLIQSGDNYYNECMATSGLIAKSLKLGEDQYVVTFQSKFGRQKWLTPATISEIINLAKSGKSIDIICPGFVSDCLETLEEINVTNREAYIKNGGMGYNYIPCFNNDKSFINFLTKI